MRSQVWDAEGGSVQLYTALSIQFLFIKVKERCGLINNGDKVHVALYQSMRSKKQEVNLSIHDAPKALELQFFPDTSLGKKCLNGSKKLYWQRLG